eukprot:CAMPEP_0180549164 /NCGR_PEP_ID=MMETSP1036_2-20121128/71973_1 /TAXON_ID=632150 /ORGANISM="Azadinium spinosum, Strain 3D9" /LENGTH=48 /DNA_ID= /DNA_START= /DNA_END= /DNA_ORIENTATION=
MTPDRQVYASELLSTDQSQIDLQRSALQVDGATGCDMAEEICSIECSQ